MQISPSKSCMSAKCMIMEAAAKQEGIEVYPSPIRWEICSGHFVLQFNIINISLQLFRVPSNYICIYIYIFHALHDACMYIAAPFLFPTLNNSILNSVRGRHADITLHYSTADFFPGMAENALLISSHSCLGLYACTDKC